MLFTTNTVKTEELNNINNFFTQFDLEFEPVKTVEEDKVQVSNVTKYVNSLVLSQYQKSVEDIQNTKIGNKIVRKRNLQQVMRESCFYGANRFGTNFIA